MASTPNLKDVLQDVPAEKLDQKCSKVHLSEISRSFADWRAVRPFLGLTVAEEEEVIYGRLLPEQRFDALRRWKEKQKDNATYRSLAQVFHLAQRVDMIDAITDVILQAPTTSQATPPPPQIPPTPQRSPVAEYGEYLKELYKEDLPIFSLQWPPLPVRKAFKLALIKPTKVRRGEIDDKYVRMTITGKVDDILHMKMPILLENIFQLGQEDQQFQEGDKEKRKRKIVLVEGAPGSGKSTMAWDSCRRWAEGDLFQEFDAVILVQLRDPEVQAATMLAELLPADNHAMAEHVAVQIAAQKGDKVLYIVDGWDELPHTLREAPLFQSLLRPQKQAALRRSAVLITSRPITSGQLHPLVTSRVEIVGFTPEELRQYFSECLRSDPGAVETLLERVEENPVVASSCYLPLNAAIIAHLFLSGNHTLPTTVHGIFTSLVLCCLYRNQRERRGLRGEAADIESLENLPKDIQKPFHNLCRLAFSGVMKDRVTFSSSDLEGVGLCRDASALGLLQVVTSMFTHKTSAYYYNFLHLQIQELLAAYYIASLSGREQISHFRKLFNQSRLVSVFQFYAGITRFQSQKKYLSKLAFFVPTQLIGPTSIRDVISTMIQNGDKQLLVSVIGCLFEANDASLCQFVAEKLNARVKLPTVTLSPLDCLALGYFLSCVSTTINEVNLERCSIDDQNCKFLMRGLSKCPTSSTSATGQLTLCLAVNSIHEEGAHHIAQVLRNSGVVQRLYLNDNPIGEAGLRFVAEALLANSSVVTLNIGRCSLKVTDENGPILQEILQKNRTLEELDLSYSNQVSDTGAVLIAEGLKHNSTLRLLNLSGCGIGHDGVDAVASALVVNNTLTYLALNANLIGEAGLKSLAGALITNSSLVKLNISSCSLKVTDENGPVLQVMLQKNRTLEELDLSGNDQVSNYGAVFFAEGLKYNSTLKDLSLYCCGISKDGVEAIASALVVNHTLEELGLGGNGGISEREISILTESLKNNQGITRLTISDRFRSLRIDQTVSNARKKQNSPNLREQ